MVVPWALAWVALGAPGLDPDDAGADRFVRYTPLSLIELYEKRMRFSAREPLISVGLMDGQSEVTIAASGAMRLMFDEVDLPKTVYGPLGSRFVFRRLAGKPARLRHWVVVRAVGAAERAAAEQEAEQWRGRKVEVKIFEAGAIVGVRGNVLDTRQLHVAIGGFEDRAAAEAEMRARAREGGAAQLFLHEELLAPPSGVIGVFDAKGTLLHRARDSVYVGTVIGARLKVAQVEHSRGYKNHGREDREFWGHLYVVVDGGGRLAVVNSVRAEKLLAGLVPAEMFASAPLEALKAQAVTARGEIFSKLAHRHFGDPFHLCSEQHCQVYRGAAGQTAPTDRAVLETRGLLAFRPRKDGQPLVLVDSVYSSSCGGHSEANEVVWGTPPSPSLRPRLDRLGADPAMDPFTHGFDEATLRSFLESYPPAACARASLVDPAKYRWKRTVGAAELESIGASLGIGRIRRVTVLGRGGGGRIRGLTFEGAAGTREVLQELPVRRLFGNLNSGLFVLDEVKNERGELVALKITGGGWGHGVGMCQLGAIGRAERGQTFDQILEHYYSGAAVLGIY